MFPVKGIEAQSLKITELISIWSKGGNSDV